MNTTISRPNDDDKYLVYAKLDNAKSKFKFYIFD